MPVEQEAGEESKQTLEPGAKLRVAFKGKRSEQRLQEREFKQIDQQIKSLKLSNQEPQKIDIIMAQVREKRKRMEAGSPPVLPATTAEYQEMQNVLNQFKKISNDGMNEVSAAKRETAAPPSPPLVAEKKKRGYLRRVFGGLFRKGAKSPYAETSSQNASASQQLTAKQRWKSGKIALASPYDQQMVAAISEEKRFAKHNGERTLLAKHGPSLADNPDNMCDILKLHELMQISEERRAESEQLPDSPLTREYMKSEVYYCIGLKCDQPHDHQQYDLTKIKGRITVSKNLLYFEPSTEIPE